MIALIFCSESSPSAIETQANYMRKTVVRFWSCNRMSVKRVSLRRDSAPPQGTGGVQVVATIPHLISSVNKPIII